MTHQLYRLLLRPKRGDHKCDIDEALPEMPGLQNAAKNY